jgi:DNA-binding protein HU-beta
MNKQELRNAIAKKTNMPKSQVLAFMDACFDEIEKSIKKGKQVRLVGFGTWKKIRRKARAGRNPQTGKKLTIKARNVAKFSMGQNFFDLLN